MAPEWLKRYSEASYAFQMKMVLLNVDMRAEMLKALGMNENEVEDRLQKELIEGKSDQWPLTKLIWALFPRIGSIHN